MDFSKLPKYSESYEPVNRNQIVTESPLQVLVGRAVEVFLSIPPSEQEDVLKALEKLGITSGEAWKLYQFIPMAFAHVAFKGSGVQFHPCYDTHNYTTGARTHKLLKDEPIYDFAIRAAERRLNAGATYQALFPVFRYSAECNLIVELRAKNVELSDMLLTPPLLPDYEPDPEQESP